MTHAMEDVNAYLKRIFKDEKVRARKRGVSFTATLNDWLDILTWQKGACDATGLKMTCQPAGHHAPARNITPILVNEDLGYTRENVRFVCARVDAMKSSMSYDSLVRWCGDIVEWDRYKSCD